VLPCDRLLLLAGLLQVCTLSHAVRRVNSLSDANESTLLLPGRLQTMLSARLVLSES
jgi:hypothetical protein